ncbi:MAG: methyltransferase domain-containing protein [Proteobacteria bacterium]|nr:methyltransferase domain-containing protein [Pseudomonadota bacterium]
MIDFYDAALKYITPLQEDVPDWLCRIKSEGESMNVPIVDDEMGQFLKIICSIKCPDRILEIGCGVSYATHWMLLGSPNSEIVALDANLDRIKICDRHLKDSGFIDQVQLVHHWANDFFDRNLLKFDLIFQDATKKEYINMIDPIYNALKIGGVLIVDNIFYNCKTLYLKKTEEKKYGKGVALLKEFNKMMSDHSGFESTFLPLSDGTLIAKRIS